MQTIRLTQGKVALVDDADFEKLSKWKWTYDNTYAQRSEYPSKRKIYMHSFIMDTPTGMQTDHINGDKLDNRRSNLRICSKSQNMSNVRVRSDNKSGFKGVGYYKPLQKYRAYIRKDGKDIHIGYFDDKKEAAVAYNLKAQEVFGEYAWLNPV